MMRMRISDGKERKRNIIYNLLAAHFCEYRSGSVRSLGVSCTRLARLPLTRSTTRRRKRACAEMCAYY